MPRHLRLQLTLLATEAGGRRGPIPPGEFRTVLVASRRHFSANLHLAEPAVPGGPAVHCEATLLDPELARPFFPAGAQFELWEGGRKGYGYVLNLPR
jgi:hypothetical protein